MNPFLATRFFVFFVHYVLWAYFGLACFITSWSLLSTKGSLQGFMWEWTPLSVTFGIQIDVISIGMLLMITLIGALIGQYSLRYLHGEKRQSYFYRYLWLTITAVSLLVLSNNLLLFFAMWLLSSFGLHHLLLYYPERKQAVRAAWKKFFISRMGDSALLIAIILTYQMFGTFDFSDLFELTSKVPPHSLDSQRLSVIGALFVLGAMSKSAQFPFHFWLPETMETPAPVSALMHAGIINAGGFLMVRLSPMLQHAHMAHFILTLLGALTAVFGALVMITQNDIKKKLAYSTISQMGVMMVSCGLRAYSIAFFHIIAHSFYKAHAFLSTGFLTEESKKVKFNHSKPSKTFLLLGALAGYGCILAGSTIRDSKYVAYFTYASILMLGFVQNIDLNELSLSKMGAKFFFILSPILILSLGICFLSEAYLHEAISGIAPILWEDHQEASMHLLSCLGAYTIFVIGLALSACLIDAQGSFSRRAYVYFWNGGYFSQRTHFLAGSAPLKGE